jgi:undecaprenyl-diphosphatase
VTWFEAALLGAVQGLFMFFPVSSTSHLVMTQHWLVGRGSALPPPESAEMILFDLVVHVGTLVSIALVMRAGLGRLGRGLAADVRGVASGAPRPERGWLHPRLVALGVLSVAVPACSGWSCANHCRRCSACRA